MKIDINVLISLGSALITLSSLFGIFYKIKYQVEQLEKKQDKHNGVIEQVQLLKNTVLVLDERQKEDRKDIDNLLKEVKDGKQ